MLKTFEDLRSSPHDDFRFEALQGLSQSPKKISPKYLYDQRGSKLFEEITQLKEYYPSRIELGLLREYGSTISDIVGQNSSVVEFGAGTGEKTRTLLSNLSSPFCYFAVDIDKNCADATAKLFSGSFPNIRNFGLCADFTKKDELDSTLSNVAKLSASIGPTLILFLGSTIGNMEPDDAVCFLNTVACTIKRGAVLIGVDLLKDASILELAYNDPFGLTSQFNLNLLIRMNRELNATFDLNFFRHQAFFNSKKNRIEMHIQSLANQIVKIDDRSFVFLKNESIHTENSYKYSVDGFQELAIRARLKPRCCWTDPNLLYSLHLLTR